MELHFIKCESKIEESATSVHTDDLQEMKFQVGEVSRDPIMQKENQNKLYIKEEHLNQDVKEELNYEECNTSTTPADEFLVKREDLPFIKCEPNNEESATSAHAENLQEIKTESGEASNDNVQKENVTFIKEEHLDQDVKEEFDYEECNTSTTPEDEFLEKMEEVIVKCEPNSEEPATSDVEEELDYGEYNIDTTPKDEMEPALAAEFGVPLSSTSTGNLCEICDKKFRNPSGLKRHLLSHLAIKPFPCKTCSKSFSTNLSLNKHTRTHTREMTYSCMYCRKRFTQKGLLIHRLTHKKDMKKNCRYCSRTFDHMSELRRHVLTHNTLFSV